MNANQAFQTVERLIYKRVHKWHSWTGWDFDELLSEAVGEWFEKFAAYDPSRSRLTTWTWHTINYALRDYRAKRMRDEARFQPSESLASYPVLSRFSSERLKASVSEDGRIAIGEALAVEHGGGRKPRMAVIEALKELGWCGERILESFAEIWEELKT